MMPITFNPPIPVNDLDLLVKLATKILNDKKAVAYICKHASSIYAQKEIMAAIRKISKIKKNLVDKSFDDRTDEECGELS